MVSFRHYTGYLNKVWKGFMSLEVSNVLLDQMILDELGKVNLNGIIVLSVVTRPNSMQVVFKVSTMKIEFVVDDNYQFQTLSVTSEGKTHKDLDYLTTFDDLVFDVMTKVKLVEMKKRSECRELDLQSTSGMKVHHPLERARLESVILREEKIKQQEYELNLRDQEIKKLEKSLYAKENENALQRQQDEAESKVTSLKKLEEIGQLIKKSVFNLLQKIKNKKA